MTTPCKHTKTIYPYECVGDSLATINSNFANLDSALCGKSEIFYVGSRPQTNTVTVRGQSTLELKQPDISEYRTNFDVTQDTQSTTLTFAGSLPLPVTQFPYVTAAPRPLASFAFASQADYLPEITLYWASSSLSNYTLYATNSAISSIASGPISFNGSVNAMLSSGNKLYVGGSFTTVGATSIPKFVTINLAGGTVHSQLSSVGSAETSLFNDVYGNLGADGSVYAIATATISSQEFIAVGGTYKSLSKGQGLTIFNSSSAVNTYYPFYINGSVKTICNHGNYLYVGGDFDFINYGILPASTVSGNRVNANGLVRIDLTKLALTPHGSIDYEHAEKINSLFGLFSQINSIQTNNDLIYVGGVFDIKQQNQLAAKNLAVLTTSGDLSNFFSALVFGPVYTLQFDRLNTGTESYLYVGGLFNSAYIPSNFYSTPRVEENSQFANAFAIKVTNIEAEIVTSWTPQFNGSVESFAFHSNASNSYVYCGGKFSSVSKVPAAYFAAVNKASNTITNTGTAIQWMVTPDATTNAVVSRFKDSVVLGGSFEKINGESRYSLARVNGVGESIYTNPLSAIAWDFGLVSQSPGSLISNSTVYERITAFANSSQTINSVTWTPAPFIINTAPGQVIRAIVRRPGNASSLNGLPSTNDTMKIPAQVLGYKISYRTR